MLVDYEQLNQSITRKQEKIYVDEILRNPYLPHGSKRYPENKVEPYFEQALILMDECDKKYPDYKLISGGAFSGKSQMIAIMAARYLIYPNYRGLILRNTYNQVVSSGGAVDKLRKWLCDSDRLGEYVCHENKKDMYFEAPTGARIYYGYCNRPDQMDKIRGTSFHIIYVEEASEIPGDILEFLPRSIRPWNGYDEIPECYVLNSNPSFGPGVDWLKKMFIDENSPHKHYTLDLMMNPYVDRIAYDRKLAEMSPLQQAFMRFGDWDYTPQQGKLITLEQLRAAEISPNDYSYDDTVMSVIGIDVAGEGDDYTSLSFILFQQNGMVIFDDNMLLNDSTIEDMLVEFVRVQKEKHNVYKVLFEGEPGSYTTHVSKHFRNVLSDAQDRYPFTVSMKRVSKNKFERARPFAYALRNGLCFVNERLPNKNMFYNQCMYVDPSKAVMKKHKSPDILDSVDLAYNYLDGLYNIRRYNREFGVEDG